MGVVAGGSGGWAVGLWASRLQHLLSAVTGISCGDCD